MKTFGILGALALAIALTATQVGAQTSAATASKVGWINLQQTLQDTKAGKTAKGKLESEKNEKQKKVNERKEKLKKQADELEKQRGVMKADALAARERELQEEYVQLQQMFVELQQDLAKSEARLTQEIFQKASTIIDEIAKRDGYTMIIEKNEGAVLWATPAHDITAEVNRRLDAGEGSRPAGDTGKPPPGSQGKK